MNDTNTYREFKIIRLRRKLLSYRQIGEEVGCSIRIVHKVLKRHAPELMEHCTTIKFKRNIDKIKKLRKQGLTYEEIGNRVGLGFRTIEGGIHRYAPELMRKSLTEKEVNQRINKIAELQRQGLLDREIAEKLNITIGMVKSYLVEARKRNIPLIVKRKKYPRLNKQQLDERNKELVRLYEEGTSVEELSKKYDIVKGRVYQIIWKEAPYINIEKHKSIEKRNRKIMKAVESGIHYSKIAEKFNVSDATVFHVIKKFE